MNKTFSFSRFWHLVRKIFHENELIFWGLFFISFISILSIYYAELLSGYQDTSYANGIIRLAKGFEDAQNFSLLLAPIGGLFVTIFITSIFDEKKKSSFYLQIPATNIEKYLSIVLVSIFAFFIGHLILQALIDMLFYKYVNKHWMNDSVNAYYYDHDYLNREYEPNPIPILYSLVSWTSVKKMSVIWAFLIHLNFVSYFILGSTYFRKIAYIKTIVVVTVVGFIVGYILSYSGRIDDIWIAIIMGVIPLILLGIGFGMFKNKVE